VASSLFYINVPNHGAVPNLPDEAVLELKCKVTRDRIQPLPMKPLPVGLRGMQMQIIDTHELTVQGYMEKDPRLIQRALAMDPIVNSLAVAERVFNELCIAERDCLEPWLFEKRSPVKLDDSLVVGRRDNAGDTTTTFGPPSDKQ
jgi:alpha-galactosidase